MQSAIVRAITPVDPLQPESVRSDPVFSSPPLAPGALRGKTVVITGASDGIGRALAESCAQAEAHVVMVGRNTAKTTHAASMVMNRTGSRLVSVETADLLFLEEQAALVARLRAAHPTLFALVNNAGALFLEREETRDGLERTFALNHVAYVTLALGLLPSLYAGAKDGDPARIVNIASRAHVAASIDFNDLQSARGYSGWSVYGRSKLANILFTSALARRVDSSRISVNAVHPGLVASRFASNNGAMGRLQRRVMNWFSVSASAGADTAAWLLASREGAQHTGAYWVCRTRTEPSAAAQDMHVADELLRTTCALAGLSDELLRAPEVSTT